MRLNRKFLAVGLTLVAASAQAAVKSQDVRYQLVIVQDGELIH